MARNKLKDNLRASKKNKKNKSKESLAKEIQDLESNLGVGRTKNINLSTLKRLKNEYENFRTSKDFGPYSQGGGITIKPGSQTGNHENILHRFATYNTLFTLSGISEEELQDHSFLNNPVHDVIARSGGIGGNTIARDSFEGTGRADDVDRIVRDAYKNFKESI